MEVGEHQTLKEAWGPGRSFRGWWHKGRRSKLCAGCVCVGGGSGDEDGGGGVHEKKSPHHSFQGSQPTSGVSDKQHVGHEDKRINTIEQFFTPIHSSWLLASHSPNYLCSFHLVGRAISPIVTKSFCFVLTSTLCSCTYNIDRDAGHMIVEWSYDIFLPKHGNVLSYDIIKWGVNYWLLFR